MIAPTAAAPFAGSSSPSSSVPDRATLVACVSFVALGGVNFVAVRFSNRELAPMFGAGVRFLLASILLMIAFVLRRQVIPHGRSLTGVLMYGFLSFTVAYAFAYYALTRLPAGIGSLVFASMPLFVVFLAHFHGLEPFRLRALVGALITLAGIAILANPFGEAVPLLPLLAMVGSAVAAAEGAVVSKMYPPVPPLVANAVAMLLGGGLLLGLSVALGEPWALPSRSETWLAVSYLIVSSAIMFALFIFVIQRWTAGSASYFTSLLPITAVLAAAPLLNEPLTAALFIGGVVVLAGVYVGALSVPNLR
ncbi:MAG: DMT family transporter [Acidimicrobiia bacterium]